MPSIFSILYWVSSSVKHDSRPRENRNSLIKQMYKSKQTAKSEQINESKSIAKSKQMVTSKQTPENQEMAEIN